ncbi:hypothetical protein EV207_13638 [Scopulibacillus darangshiensis]|uniref:Uncharacterized protein n=1 Tax=Scopulibacillus darangshiensis TaxID=442528 RepID=A0A4R2NLE6_9BACL|nr:hypothetical protein [Scopulibacillus darangshiensis]TCP22351.1 hypothetical protein EV207_13638 [Scopulibacillus darangshiensis]
MENVHYAGQQHYNNANVNNIVNQCKQNLYQPVQVETTDGQLHQGILHSYDNEKLYLLMPHNRDHETQDERVYPYSPFGFGLYGFPFYGVRRFWPYRPFWW